MKKIIFCVFIAILAVFAIPSCGVGSYSVSSGREDVAGLSFTDKTKRDIVVSVDGKNYNTQTIKTKAYKPGMKIRQTVINTIKIKPGQHNVVVKDGNTELIKKHIFVSTGENKIINL